MAERRSLRPAGFDDLGLRRGLGDRMLPWLVAAMAFLAALAIAGSEGAAALARHWQRGAAASVTVQVPQPGDRIGADGSATRLDQVLAMLRATPGIATARPLGDGEVAALLRPWLGDGAARLSLPLPAVIAVHLADADADLGDLDARLATAVPGTLFERHGVWVQRLTALARSLVVCAWAVLLVVTAVAASVLATAVRGAILARRAAIEIVHELGAGDGYIANRFAGRAARLAAVGGSLGAAAALPVLLTLARIALPFVASGSAEPPGWAIRLPVWLRDEALGLATLPLPLWVCLIALPPLAAAIGFAAAQVTVRRWLRRLP